MRRVLVSSAALLLLLLLGTGFFYWRWTATGPMASSGGLWFPKTILLPVPGFAQNDPRWGDDFLGATPGRLGGEGCAVTSAAMVLCYFGIPTDPHFLNLFLTETGGYTPQGWIEWEGAEALRPGTVRKVYEDLPSHFLVDRNLWRGIPSIVRLRMRGGTTHFVVIVGKRGFDYLIRDPGAGFAQGVYPLRELTPQIEALRFYVAGR
ncbi:Peptidase C39 family protein [Verrucomicrobium sp. GAS474]|uniref:hypothetical protein n=1 Tax=Verrucomicrobium sp. GAS474 TaxID=1882831 RepID=UPI00087CCE04|nr:hypothetical protein [Verrucomicrobium sp. GAS474]SDU27112.1 Peptidase C39 family protein [Verrucomicrobium sp. GAS474]